MRIPIFITLAITTLLVTPGARAQTYDPDYPVCMKVYRGGLGGGGEWNDCRFTSIPQCRATASGLAAMCVVNPFYAYNQTPGPRRPRRAY